MNHQEQVAAIRLGKDSVFDAWIYSMLMDNNLAYVLNPHLIASQEQLSFMVQLEPGQIYLPCSDATFHMLGSSSPALQKAYNRVWRTLVGIIQQAELNPIDRHRLFQFLRIRFRQYTAQKTLLPSRLMKRITDLIFYQSFSPIPDPWQKARRDALQEDQQRSADATIAHIVNAVDPKTLPATIDALRTTLHHLELVRLLVLTVLAHQKAEDLAISFNRALTQAHDILPLFTPSPHQSKTILVLPDADGSTFFEILTIQALLRMGHKVIYAVKHAPFFLSPILADFDCDPLLESLCKKAFVVSALSLGKNALLAHLKTHQWLIIDDGTRERLNLYRVSVTFARAWKEADIILAHGWRAKDMFLETSHSFTRDIVVFWNEGTIFRIQHRPHAKACHKFAEADIVRQAETLIGSMRKAHRENRRVMFFSCIVGSIPGETKQAIELATVFVNHLRKQMDNMLIINPAEHFVPGMDGDDLMYMWERVQRSGEIDIWRFQSTTDIEQSFALLGRTVPPIWSGKDATYSTGCTKEMKIALDVQEKNPEMQIIGPDPKRFFRRGEYGVGKYVDAQFQR